MFHLYKTVVLPSVLFGCELWNNLSYSDLHRLNTFQHFVCKNALNLPKLCRSDICESFFDVLPIEAEIDTRKLLFLGRLCRLNSTALTKKIFMTRLYAFTYNLARTQRGFIPETIKLLQKYGLTDHLQSWLQDGSIANELQSHHSISFSVKTVFSATPTYQPFH